MKLKFKVTELSHEDIVEILSSACYANEYMSIRYNKNLLKDVTRQGSDCLEDRAADLLLAGKHIYVIDWDAKGQAYGDLPHSELEDDVLKYRVTLEDFINGMNTEEAVPYVYQLYEDGVLTSYSAYMLLQIIVFGEEIYG